MKRSLLIGIAVLMVGCSHNEETLEVVNEPETRVIQATTIEPRDMVEEVEREEVEFDNKYDSLIYHAARDTSVDPYLAIAISRLETGHYTSRAFVEGYNFGGITVSSGIKQFDSLHEGLYRFITLLEWYYSKGMDSPEKIQPVYCPPNETWDEVVSQIYEGLTKGES